MICNVCGQDKENIALQGSPEGSHRATIKGQFFDLSGLTICTDDYNQIGESEDIATKISRLQKQRREQPWTFRYGKQQDQV